jgi:nitric oxide reductase subunit B
MRMPGDIVFAVAALLMAWDFMVKLLPPRKDVAPQPIAAQPQRAG